MKRFALLALLLSASVLAEPIVLDAGPVAASSVTTAVMSDINDAGQVTTTIVTTQTSVTVLDDPAPFARIAFEEVSKGNWWGGAAALLVLFVAILRAYGKKIHDAIPDDNPLDKPFWFIFETKPGGWLLNVLTAIAGGLGTAIVAHIPITWAIVWPVLKVSVTAAALWELGNDVYLWIKSKAIPLNKVQ